MDRIVCTLNLYDRAMRRGARESIQHAAKQWGARYVELSQPLLPEQDPYLEKLSLDQRFERARVVYLDRDVVVRGDCPNLFDIVPEGVFAAVPSEQEGHNLLDKIRPAVGPLVERLGLSGSFDYDRDYFNSGVLIFDLPAHAGVFARARELAASTDCRSWEVYDQGVLSLAIKALGVPSLSLPPCFNRCGAVVWSRWQPRMDDFVWHFCGMGNPAHQINNTRWWDLGPDRHYHGMCRWEKGKPFGSMNHTPLELTLLLRELSKVWNGTVVEVGTYMGGSTWAMVLLTHLRGSRVTCVDPWSGSTDISASPETWEHVYECFQKNMEECNFRRFVDVLRAPSVEAAGRFADESAALVYLDGNHDHASVKADIEAWWPKVATGGVLMGHDYSPSFPGVISAVEEAFGRPEELSEGHCRVWKVTKS
jgi:lipopolysaccharide biosynthesis glycosyltransferase